MPTDAPEPRRVLADHLERRRRAAVAGHTGDAPTARALLGDPDPGVRATALGALARLGELAAEELARAAADADATVRRRAAELVGTWEDGVTGAPAADGVLRLGRLLDDGDDRVVEMAAWAAGERLGRAAEAGADLPEPEVVDRLAALATGHDEPLVREAAVAALGAIGDGRGLPAILAGCEDRATVRRRAVLALAPFDGPEVDAALERASHDRDWQVRQAAEDLLGR